MIFENGLSIDVFDDVFPLMVRNNIYSQCVGANYQIAWESMGLLERGSYGYHLNSRLPDEAISNLGVFEHLQKNKKIMDLIGGMKLKGTYINLTVATDAYHIHNDVSGKTLLYYVNPDWQEGWGGETLFWSDDLSEIIYASPYVSGRLVIFDGPIPHSVRPQSNSGPKYRFSMAMMMSPE